MKRAGAAMGTLLQSYWRKLSPLGGSKLLGDALSVTGIAMDCEIISKSDCKLTFY